MFEKEDSSACGEKPRVESHLRLTIQVVSKGDANICFKKTRTQSALANRQFFN